RWDYSVDAPIFVFHTSDSIASSNKRPVISFSGLRETFLTVRGSLISRITLHTEVLQPSQFELAHTSQHADVIAVWQRNPMAEVGVNRIVDLDLESYPVLPHLTLESDAGTHPVYDRRAVDIRKAFCRTWVAGFIIGKQVGDTELFKRYADAYWERLAFGSEESPENIESRRGLTPEQRHTHKLDDQKDWGRYRDGVANRQRLALMPSRWVFREYPQLEFQGNRSNSEPSQETCFKQRRNQLRSAQIVPHPQNLTVPVRATSTCFRKRRSSGVQMVYYWLRTIAPPVALFEGLEDITCIIFSFLRWVGKALSCGVGCEAGKGTEDCRGVA
ncbi:hypothetical protein BU25DRAFT_471649, partial [Macroventuria anomochaeta]